MSENLDEDECPPSLVDVSTLRETQHAPSNIEAEAQHKDRVPITLVTGTTAHTPTLDSTADGAFELKATWVQEKRHS